MRHLLINNQYSTKIGIDLKDELGPFRITLLTRQRVTLCVAHDVAHSVTYCQNFYGQLLHKRVFFCVFLLVLQPVHMV
jgi:hypothetical protein